MMHNELNLHMIEDSLQGSGDKIIHVQNDVTIEKASITKG